MCVCFLDVKQDPKAFNLRPWKGLRYSMKDAGNEHSHYPNNFPDPLVNVSFHAIFVFRILSHLHGCGIES